MIESLRETFGSRLSTDRRAFENLQRLILRPTDEQALGYFGIDLAPHARRYLDRYYPMLKKKLRDPRVRDNPKLLRHLLTLVQNPLDPEAAEALGLTRYAPVKVEDPREAYISRTRDYLINLQGGFNLVSLLTAEGDIDFGYSSDDRWVVLEHRGRSYRFERGPEVVARIIEKIIEIKPWSRFIHQKERVGGYSYREILEILKED